MTVKEINNALTKEVETAVNNVANAYDGAFQIKKSDEGTDRTSNFTIRLSSNDWRKSAAIKFSIDKPSDYFGEPDDPYYYASCVMGMTLDRYSGDGFVGEKHCVDYKGKFEKDKVGKFIEEVFLPSSIEILKFAKTNAKKLASAEWTKFRMRLRDFYRDMWKGTIEKVPTEEQISQLFFDKSNVNESDESEEIRTGEKYFEVHCVSRDRKKEETFAFPKRNADEGVAAEHAYYLLKQKGWTATEIAAAEIDVELKTKTANEAEEEDDAELFARFAGDGWDCDVIEDSGIYDTLGKIGKLEYALRHNTRRSCNFGETLADLKAYIDELADELKERSDDFIEE